MYRVGFKTDVKVRGASPYCFWNTYYDDAREAYDDTLDCQNEEIEAGIKMHGYYVLKDTNSGIVYSLEAFKKFILKE